MSTQEHDNLRRIFDLALSVSGEERALLLARECSGDEGLQARIEAMLRAAEDEDFLAAPTGDWTPISAGSAASNTSDADTAVSPIHEGPGTRIGPYKLLQLIGEGGFGSVFMAEQEKPVRRKVALKVIKLGMDTRRVVARFEAERQALALMDHPNIARVFDAGATETGRPFFVMELVKGVPITEYCDKQNMSFNERLALFVQVCSAVQHAHQKGIIHRDLKPSNILVTHVDDKPSPKVIDFGIAKATQQRLTEQTMFTEFGQFIGTPAYMSPEQADPIGDDIDTRSDIYSLGVILYQLLTGVTPFDIKTLRAAALDEIKRIIREVDPPRPSTRLSSLGDELNSVARQRALEPRRLGTILRGDLDWVIMKALEKDRTRRYETANGLAADLERYLHHEPVSATPPSNIYRLRKFAIRNRGLVTAGLAVAFALTLGVAGTTYGMIVARQQQALAIEREMAAISERQRAEAAEADARARANEVEQVAEFQSQQFRGIDIPLAAIRLHADLLDKVRSAALEAKLSATDVDARLETVRTNIAGSDFAGIVLNAFEKSVFAPALIAIEEEFDAQPAVRARLLQTVAYTTRELGMLEFAEGPQRAALETRMAVLGKDHPDTLVSMMQLGSLLRDRGKLVEAEPYFLDALSGLRRAVGDDDRRTLTCLLGTGNLRQLQGRLDDAAKCYSECMERGARALGAEDRLTLQAAADFGYLLCFQNKPDEAEKILRQALDGHRRVLGYESPETLQTLNALGALMRFGNRLDEADKYYSEALETRRRVLGDDHPQTLTSFDNMGGIRYSQGKYEESLEFAERAYEGRMRTLGDRHLDTLHSVFNIGALLMKMGRADEAEQKFRLARDGFMRILGRDRPDTVEATFQLGVALLKQKKNDDAERIFREAIESGSRGLGEAHPKTIESVFGLADLLEHEDRSSEAAQLIQKHETSVRQTFTDRNISLVGVFLSRLGESFRKAHEFEAGEKALLEAYDVLKTERGEDHASTKQCALRLAELFEDWNTAAPNQAHADSAKKWRIRVDGSASEKSDETPITNQ